jgi:hypothetical protein
MSDPLTYDDIATIWDERHPGGGRKARTLPIHVVVAWVEKQPDVRYDEDADLFYLEK